MPLSQAELAILVTGKDVSATRVMRGVSREADRFGTKLAGIGSRAGRNFARNLERTVIAGGVAAAGAIGYAVKVAGDFEAQLNIINTIARETPDGLTAIGDSIRAIARETGTPLEELTQGYYDLLSAGVKAADATNVLRAANTLSIGGLSTAAEAVDLLTTAINTYGGDATKAAAYSDIFAKAVERGKVTAAEIAASFATVGPIAAANGIEIQELSAGYARLTAAGVPASEAATQMRSALVGLIRTTGPLEALQKATGRNYLSIAGKEGLVVALEQLRIDATKAGVPLIDLLGRVEGLNFTMLTTGANFDAYNADLAAMDAAGGTAAEQAAERMKGFQFQWQRLRSNVQDAAITIGTELLPVFADLAEEGTAWLQGHQPEIKQFALDLAAGIRDAVEWAKKMDWDAIARALGSGADAAKAIVSAFLAMPPEMKGLLIGGYAVNKVTGGAVTDVAGLAIKTALSQFAMRGSSPANPLYVMPIGAGLGVPPGGPVPGGGRGGLIGGLVGLGSGLLILDGLAKLPDAFSNFATIIEAGADGNVTAYKSALDQFVDQAGGWLPGAGLIKAFTAAIPDEIKVTADGPDKRAGVDWDNFRKPRRELRRYQRTSEDRKAEVDWSKFTEPVKDVVTATREGAKDVDTAVERTRAAIVGAIHAKDLSVRTTIHMPVNDIRINVPPATLLRQIIRTKTGGGVRQVEGGNYGGGGSQGGQGGHNEFG